MDMGKRQGTKVPHKTLLHEDVKPKPHPNKAADRAKFAKGGKKK